MTIRELATNWIEHSEEPVTFITAADAARYISWMDQQQIPDDLTPETFADIWNDVVGQHKLTEMRYQIEKVEHMAERSMVSAYEASERITEIISKAFPLDEIGLPDEDVTARCEIVRRQAFRRMWRFLLRITGA